MLDQRQREQYFEDGFLAVSGYLGAAWLDRLRAVATHVHMETYPAKLLPRWDQVGYRSIFAAQSSRAAYVDWRWRRPGICSSAAARSSIPRSPSRRDGTWRSPEATSRRWRRSELGSLAPGMAADAVVMDLEEGNFTYVDFARNEVKTTRRFRTRHVIRDGRRLSAAQSDLL